MGKRGWPHAHAWPFCGSDFCSAPRGWAGVGVVAALTEIHVLGSTAHPSASPESFIPLIGLNLFTFLHPMDGYLSMSHVNGALLHTLGEHLLHVTALPSFLVAPIILGTKLNPPWPARPYLG